MGPKSRVKRKAQAAAQASAESRKKKRVRLQAVYCSTESESCSTNADASEASETATTTVSGPGFSGDHVSSVASASSSMNVEPSVAVADRSSRVVDHEIDAPHTALTTEEEESELTTQSDLDAPKTPHKVLSNTRHNIKTHFRKVRH